MKDDLSMDMELCINEHFSKIRHKMMEHLFYFHWYQNTLYTAYIKAPVCKSDTIENRIISSSFTTE
jgi:hypothetical protein